MYTLKEWEEFSDQEPIIDITDLKQVINDWKTSIDKPDGCWVIEKWDDDEEGYICSVCEFELYLLEGNPTDNNYNYCPKCGSQLIVKKEMKDK